MIEANGETIIKLLIHLKNRKQVCQALLMCSSDKAATVRTTRALGAVNCSRGPGYWCETLENAKECGNSVSCNFRNL